MICEPTQRDGLWVCQRCQQPPLPGPDWRRQCRETASTGIRELAEGSVRHAIATGLASRTIDQALSLLEQCDACSEYDATFGCLHGGGGCGTYARWIARLTQTGCDVGEGG